MTAPADEITPAVADPPAAGVDNDLAEDALGEDDLAEEELVEDGVAGAVAVGHNTGQVAGIVYGGLHQHFDRVRAYHELTQEYVSARLRGFVEPDYRASSGQLLTSDDVVALLTGYGAAVLVGAAGSGRHTAALRLLNGTRAVLREIRPTFDPGRGEQLAITELPVEPGFAYLLELPQQVTQIEDGFARDLAGYAAALAQRRSCVVVTVTEEVWTQLGAAHDVPVLRVGVPPAAKVLGLRLRQLFPDLDLSWLPQHPTVAPVLANAAPAEAVRLAQIAADVLNDPALSPTVRHGLRPDSPVGKEMVEALVSAYHNWEAELTAWFAAHPEPRHRLFLVATAALEGIGAGRVLRAAEDLGAHLDGGDEALPSLAAEGVRSLVTAVEARLDDSHLVRFRRARYGEAVLDFVITDRTDEFQRQLWRWVARLPLRGTVVDRALVARTADLVLRTALRRRSPDVLAMVMPTWARRAELRRSLSGLLGVAALSPEIGVAIRQRLYRWATVRNHPSVLVTVAQVCGGELADFYVEQALVRLGHLARHGLPEVDDAVLEALTAIWARPPLRPAVLHRISGWLNGAPERRFALACRALELLATPEDDADGEPIDAVLAEAMAATGPLHDLALALGGLMDESRLPPGITGLLHRWLDAGTGDERVTRALAQLLVGAVAARSTTRRVARLQGMLCAWQPTGTDLEHPARAHLRAYLIRQLHRADAALSRRPHPSN